MPTKTPRINRLVQLVRFLRVARLLLWTIWVLYRERRRVARAHARGDYTERPTSDVLIEVLVAFREMAVELGVLMIKLGQFLICCSRCSRNQPLRGSQTHRLRLLLPVF